MKILSLFLKVTVTFVFAVCLWLNFLGGEALALGQFSATCEDVSISSSTDLTSLGEPTLSAECQKKDGSYVQTSIKLNPYLGNDGNGIVTWGRNNAGLGCYDFAVSNESLLSATCFNFLNKNSEDVATSINLDEHIVNIDGQLKYE